MLPTAPEKKKRSTKKKIDKPIFKIVNTPVVISFGSEGQPVDSTLKNIQIGLNDNK
nr:MAG: hypothetical protein [Lake Baikal virophage 11]